MEKDVYVSDGRTALVVRNGTRTVKKMFMTEAECAAWVAKQNKRKP